MSISLQKGEKVLLVKQSADCLQQVFMGLGWDVAPQKKGLLSFLGVADHIDLDASCLLFNSQQELVDTIWFEQLQSQDGSVRHTGDNVTGEGDGDDELIMVDLARLPQTVTSLVFVVNSFTGQDFSRVANARCRLVDQTHNREIANYQLNSQGAHTAITMVRLYRKGSDWKIHAIGEPGRGKTFHDLLPAIRKHLV
ncbi:MAG: TerD family protein [Magnetococcales bacterium]|nr:TerD family protein [Magnetococcales bacterium]